MSDCQHIQKAGRYYDRELSKNEAAAFEAHLASCPACAQELSELRDLTHKLGEASTPPAANASKRLYATSVAVRERTLIRTAEWLTAAAAMILIVMGGWLLSGNDAAATSALPTSWELTAVGITEDATATDADQFAQWVVADLSRGDSQ